jgi:hypothetical protein
LKFPVLIAAVRERIPVEILTDDLRDRLRKSDAIKDLPGILEELLANDLGKRASGFRKVYVAGP